MNDEQISLGDMTEFLESIPFHHLPPFQRGSARAVVVAIRSRLNGYDPLLVERDKIKQAYREAAGRVVELLDEKIALKIDRDKWKDDLEKAIRESEHYNAVKKERDALKAEVDRLTRQNESGFASSLAPLKFRAEKAEAACKEQARLEAEWAGRALKAEADLKEARLEIDRLMKESERDDKAVGRLLDQRADLEGRVEELVHEAGKEGRRG